MMFMLLNCLPEHVAVEVAQFRVVRRLEGLALQVQQAAAVVVVEGEGGRGLLCNLDFGGRFECHDWSEF